MLTLRRASEQAALSSYRGELAGEDFVDFMAAMTFFLSNLFDPKDFSGAGNRRALIHLHTVL